MFQRGILIPAFLGSFFLFLLAAPAWADRVDDWIGKLQSSKASERRAAASELGKSKDPRAVLPLIQLFRDAEPMVRLDASGALIQIGSPVVEALVEEIKIEDDSVFLWNAIRVLENIGDARAIDPIRKIKENHQDPSIQQIAGYTLDKLSRVKKQ